MNFEKRRLRDGDDKKYTEEYFFESQVLTPEDLARMEMEKDIRSMQFVESVKTYGCKIITELSGNLPQYIQVESNGKIHNVLLEEQQFLNFLKENPKKKSRR